jgi:hypothetical protein
MGKWADLSGYWALKGAALLGDADRRQPVGNIFNSNGNHVAVVKGSEIFDLTGNKLYVLKGTSIHRLSGGLVGHLSKMTGSDGRLDRSADRLFSGAINLTPTARRTLGQS